MDDSHRKQVFRLQSCVTQGRWDRMQRIIAQRSRHITPVLEYPRNPHNVSAALRSAECCGIQDVHIVQRTEAAFAFDERISCGAGQWLTVHRHTRSTTCTATKNCYQDLRSRGYLIAATTLSDSSISIDDLPLHNKVALVFGTEASGITQEAHDEADLHTHIPMAGFTQSFNLSVTVALYVRTLAARMRRENVAWQLSEDDYYEVLHAWLRVACRSRRAGQK